MHSRHEYRFVLLCLAKALVIAAIGTCAAATCLAQDVVDRIERAFTVKERPLIYVRNSDGRSVLRATHSSEVRVLAVKEVRNASSADDARQRAAQVEVRIEQVGNRVEVEARYPKISGFWNHGAQVLVHFDISGPVESDVEAHTSDGALDTQGFDGRLELSTSDGKLTATDCSGQITAHVSDGEMRILGAQGEVDARSSDGSMTLDGTFKSLNVKSSDGSVEIAVRPGSVMARPWSVSTSDGGIQMRLPDGFSAELDIRTSDGSIRIDHPITLAGGIVSKHHVTGKLNGGGTPLHIQASDGSVHITK